MQATKKRTGRDTFCDVGDCGVRVVGGRNVVKRQKNSSYHLGDENKKQAGAENVGEPGATGDWLVERGMKKSVQTGASI